MNEIKTVMIPIQQIRALPNRGRKNFSGVMELMNSIKEKGLLHPITVKRAGDSYELVTGECRFRALSLLCWKEVPCCTLS